MSVTKTYVPEIEITKGPDGEDAITAIVSTSSPDRDMEVVLAAGVDLKNYRKNPVVLFGHNSNAFPVGKCSHIKFDRKNDVLVAKTVFAPTEEGQKTFTLMKEKFLNAFSIGFMPDFDPKHFGPPSDDEIKENKAWKGVRTVIRKSELWEYSVVPIPANPEALQRSVKSRDIWLPDSMASALGVEVPPKKTVVRVNRIQPKFVPLPTPEPMNVKFHGKAFDEEAFSQRVEESVRIKNGEILFE